MITVLLVDDFNQVVIRRYATDSTDEACRLLMKDWIAGKIQWDVDYTTEAFTPEWLERNGLDPISSDFSVEEQEGVRLLEWYSSTGPTESDDYIVQGFFVKSVP